MRTAPTGCCRRRELPDNVDPLDSKLARPGGARPYRPRLRPRARQARRLRPAGPALERRGQPRRLGQRALAAAARAAVPRARRFARRLQDAALLASSTCRHRPTRTIYPLDPLVPRGPLPDRDEIAQPIRRVEQPARRRPPAAGRAGDDLRRRAHGDRLRDPRRHPVRLHAAGGDGRGLSGSSRRGRGERARRTGSRCMSRAIRRPTIRASRSSR